MANFPASVTSFTSRSAGQTIQPAHVNDLQDEVNAIEDGYINATARLNSSNSTLSALSVTNNSTFTGSVVISSNLQVTGTSTFAGNVVHTGGFTSSNSTMAALSVTGNSTITGSLTVSSNLTVGGVLSGGIAACKARNSVAIQFSSVAGWLGLNFDTQDYNRGSLHSTTTNSSRITFKTSTGIWSVGASVTISTTLGFAGRHGRIMMNDSSVVTFATSESSNSSVVQPINMSADLIAASTADYITVQTWVDGGSTARILAHSTSYPCVFWARFIST